MTRLRRKQDAMTKWSISLSSTNKAYGSTVENLNCDYCDIEKVNLSVFEKGQSLLRQCRANSNRRWSDLEQRVKCKSLRCGKVAQQVERSTNSRKVTSEYMLDEMENVGFGRIV